MKRKYIIKYIVKITPSSDPVEQSIEVNADNDLLAVSKSMTSVRIKHTDYYQILPISVYTEDVRKT